MWSIRTPGASDPVLQGDTLFHHNVSKTLYALDSRTGKRRWSFPLPSRVLLAPVVAGGVVHLADDDGTLRAVDARTGEQRWSFSGGEKASAPATVLGDTVFFAASDKGRARYHLHALSV
ncbi:PQQ-binding-like beta-propeller repeat protein [Streptomyces sp. C11-1]|uniref:PQQ-binding-like beta-propeller repeat protein n=1 Tax=Streptomyces durocortorensis TaxID=2811104 RepID=A0ABY9W4L7_9ACTN|nr:PQQ-binding-like beta-propeller repeat protein [Streptomyces durocortorensis]WNF31089.1 PQQ-binding-like beta-propeller repeat protein [Streptomyces durocortorensis]